MKPRFALEFSLTNIHIKLIRARLLDNSFAVGDYLPTKRRFLNRWPLKILGIPLAFVSENHYATHCPGYPGLIPGCTDPLSGNLRWICKTLYSQRKQCYRYRGDGT